MKITTVTPIIVRVPMDRPTAISTRALSAREYIIVTIATDEGLEGVGYTYAGTVGGAATADFIAALRPLLVGQNSAAIGQLWAAMYQEVMLAGRRGAALRAISAIDLALWDLLGNAAGMPLARLLGGWMDAVPAYASRGYYRPGDPIEHIREEMAFYRDRGFSDFKIKVGGAPFDVDVRRVESARETIGPGARLALDANNAWRWPYEALRFARAVEELDIWWFEEPCHQMTTRDMLSLLGFSRLRSRRARSMPHVGTLRRSWSTGQPTSCSRTRG